MDNIESEEGKQLAKIRGISPDTAAAWQWIQEHQGEFEKEVYGPPLISCSIKDNRYTHLIEACLKRGDFLSITAQTTADWNKLRLKFQDMRLKDFQLRSLSEESGADPRLSEEEMQRYGFEHLALDLIDAPEPVLRMLRQHGLRNVGLGLQESSEDQYHMIERRGFNTWVTGKSYYKITRRAEYGAGAVSTQTNSVRAATYWTNRPVDTSRGRELQARIDAINAEKVELDTERLSLREQLDQMRANRNAVQKEVVSLSR